MKDKEDLIEELESEINGIELLIDDYQDEIDDLELGIRELETKKNILERELTVLLESVEEWTKKME